MWRFFSNITTAGPALKMLCAALVSGPARRDLLVAVALRDLRSVAQLPSVLVITPKRFLKPRRLRKKKTALENFLDFARLTQDLCAERGIACRLGTKENLASLRLENRKSPVLIFSHHTIADEQFEALEAVGHVVYHFKSGDLPITVSVDRRGFSGWSSIAQKSVKELTGSGPSQKEVDRFFAEEKANILMGNLSKYDQQDPVNRTALPAQPYVFIACQTIDDMVQQNAYVPMLDKVQMVVDDGFTVEVRRLKI